MSSQPAEETEPVLWSRKSSLTSSKVDDYGSVSFTVSYQRRAPPQIKTYRRRWWIVFLFWLCSAVQSAQWNAWSPITDAVEIVYGWDTSVIASFPAASDAAFLMFGLLVMYAVDQKGLRFGTVLSACMVMSTMALWNLALYFKGIWLVEAGSLFNGVANAIFMAAPPLLSVTWFPVNERTTATAIAAGAVYSGYALGFISGPYISGPDVTPYDVTHKANLSADYVDGLRAGITNYMYFNTGLAVLCFLCVIVYYPAKPPTPPSISADTQRMDFWTGLKTLMRNPQFHLLNAAFNIPNGTFNSWLPLISINFRDLEVSENTAAWMGCTSMLAGCVSSVVMSWFTDRHKKKVKLLLAVTCCLSIAGFTALACIQEKYIRLPESAVTGVLYTLVIFVGVWANGVVPLYYELGCEVAYPVPEGLTNSVITVVNTALGMVYFMVCLNPILATDTQWMTWSVLGAYVLSLPLLLLMKESFSRLELENERPKAPS